MKTKICKAFTIDSKIWEQFSTIADKMALNKSKLIEQYLKEFNKNNDNTKNNTNNGEK